MNAVYNVRPVPGQSPVEKPRRRKHAAWLLILPLVVGVYVLFALLRPLPAPKTVLTPPVTPAQRQVSIPWPAQGQAAFGADGYGLLDTKGPESPAPTASTTKVITALTVLQKKPLKAGEQGPPIPLTARDVASYYEYAAMNGAVVPVLEGSSITQYQAMQALLLPSANNIADTLVIWAFGSMDAYTTAANSYVRGLGMTNTTVSDASGFSPKTVSTPGDLVKLGDVALDHPVVADIVSQKQAVFPNAGEIQNVNNFLGTHGIRGIKTGTTDEAGGCYLAAADVVVGGKTITVITAIMGSTTRPQAMRDSLPLIQSAVSQFYPASIVRKGQTAGKVTTVWGGSTDIVADADISVLTWNGTSVAPKASKKAVPVRSAAGTDAGSFTVDFNGQQLASGLRTKDAVPGPSMWWRITNPW